MKFLNPVTRLKVVTGKESAALREHRYQIARAHLALKIQEVHLSDEDIMAEIQALREGE
ncbi:hypothetical protein [Sulfobacillus thermosulfidooxidans]|uniref:hypothetical protein n=1 Tax=Sulfobacillus thermosulfidooxidans TaxID=28034 RepID=UPI000AEAAB24|nr:hypothetical protein [Sulfobacillus thermosulfidooxidans]